jgi:exonuclease III
MAFTKLINQINEISFNSFFKKNTSEINEIQHLDYLNFFNLNIRSFNKNNLELKGYLNSFCFRFDFIILVEIWANFEFSTDKFLQGYNLCYTTNSYNKNGGVAIYSKAEINIYNLDLIECLDTRDNKNLDIVGIKFEMSKQKFALFGIYNHNANKIESFNKTLLNLIKKFGNDNKIIIASDLNINLLNYGVTNSITDYVDSLIDNNISFIVDSPTRITNNSKTLIDNFLLFGFNMRTEIFYSNLDCNITDHNALILGLKLTIRKMDKMSIIYRPFNKELINKFNANFKKDFIITETSAGLNRLLNCNVEVKFFSAGFDFDSLDLMTIINNDTIEKMFSIFSSLLLKIQNNWFPIISRELQNNTKKIGLIMKSDCLLRLKINIIRSGKNMVFLILF